MLCNLGKHDTTYTIQIQTLSVRYTSVQIQSDDSLAATEAETGRGVERVGGESCV